MVEGAGLTWTWLLVLALGGGDLLDRLSVREFWDRQGVEVTAWAMRAELTPPAVTDAAGWIKDLGSEQFATRAAARKALVAMGGAVAGPLEAATGVADPEVAEVARGILREIREGAGLARARRLMAARALGEMKDAESAPLLRELSGSTEGFVAAYAQRALAAIEGRPPPVTEQVSAGAMAGDLAMVPVEAGILAQFRVSGQEVGAGGGPREATSTAKLSSAAELMDIASRIGNARVDAVTLGVASDPDTDSGWVVVVLRGRYDAGAVRSELARGGRELELEGRRGAKAVAVSEVCVVWPASDERLVMVAGPAVARMPLKAIVEAMESGRAAGVRPEAVRGLLERTETTSPIWGVAQLAGEMGLYPITPSLDRLTAEVRRQGETWRLSVRGWGTDAEAVGGAVKVMRVMLREYVTSLETAAEQLPLYRPVLESFRTAEVTSEGAKATLEVALTGGPGTLLRALAVPLLAGGVVLDQGDVEGP